LRARYAKQANEGVRMGTSSGSEVRGTLQEYPLGDMGVWYASAMAAYEEQVAAGTMDPADEAAVRALFVAKMPATVKADYDTFPRPA
jgi:hypothetical protein